MRKAQVPPRIYHKFIKLPENILRGKVPNMVRFLRCKVRRESGSSLIGPSPETSALLRYLLSCSQPAPGGVPHA